MKKMNVRAFELGAVEILDRAQLKNVVGGVLEEPVVCKTCQGGDSSPWKKDCTANKFNTCDCPVSGYACLT